MNDNKRFRKIVLIAGVIFVVGALVGGGIWLWQGREVTGQEMVKAEGKTLYHCPMHPTYTSDRPGECPICGMDLVPVEEEAEEELEGIPGLAAITITPEKQQLIGVKTGMVETLPLEKTVRTVGIVEVDETRLAHVNAKIRGWIEDLYVDYTGKLVKKGQPLLTIYSPELVSTQEEYLMALESKKRLEKSPFPEIVRNSQSLLEATRRRLELWDISPKEIKRLEREGKPRKTLTLYSPVSGYVMHKTALEGMHIKAGMELFTIADLSQVWVEADIYEYEVPLVKTGQRATLTLDSYPGEIFTGKVTYIYPYLEKQTRTVKVRFEFANRQLKLKPEMYANVEIKVPGGEKLVVPEEAVLDTGTRQIVFLALDEGRFEPREVKLGVQWDSYFEVLEGLSEGDKIVTSGNFLIASESNVQAAIRGMTSKSEHQH